MPFKGEIGEVVEIERGDGGMSSFEWRIPDFPSLAGEGGDWFISPDFDACDGEWFFLIYPKGFWQDSPWDWVSLYLWRRDDGPPQTLDVTLGIRGAEGVENKRGRRQEFSNDDDECYWSDFCLRSDLAEQNSRLMPGNVLIISLDMKSVVPTVAREASTQTDEDCKEAEVPNKEKQEASTQTDEDCKEAEVHTEKNESSEKQAAIDDDIVEKNNNDEDHEESTNRKNVNQLSQVKSTKKIFLPSRHGDVIRSLKALLAGGRRADFTLKSGGGEWPVHRAILEGRSGHFEALFRGEWAERSEVRLDDVPEGALDGVLHFAYAGEVGDLSAESVCGTYAAAHRFLLRDLKSLCVESMEERMGPEMVCGALAVAEAHGEGDLKERAMECFFRESDRVVATEGWRELKEKHPAIIGELFQEFIKRERKKRRKEGE